MSPSSWEQRTLSSLADELAASDPKLASTLAAFNRLTWGEEMPACQHADGIRREHGSLAPKPRPRLEAPPPAPDSHGGVACHNRVESHNCRGDHDGARTEPFRSRN
jgi:hypothetical protein